jgi:hypothetical protein
VRPRAGFQQELINPTAETHLPTECLDFGPQPPHYRGQFESTDMGPVLRENLTIRTAGHQFFQNFAAVMVRITDLAVKLPIREGTGTAFAELGIGFGIELSRSAPKPKRICRSLFHGLSPFQQQRAEPHLSQKESSEITTRTSSDHHRPLLEVTANPFRSLSDIAVVGVWGRPNSSITMLSADQRRLAIHCYIDGVNQLNAIAPTGINAPLHQLTTKQTRRRNLQAAQNGLFQIIRAVIQRKTKLTKSQHRL